MDSTAGLFQRKSNLSAGDILELRGRRDARALSSSAYFRPKIAPVNVRLPAAFWPFTITGQYVII